MDNISFPKRIAYLERRMKELSHEILDLSASLKKEQNLAEGLSVQNARLIEERDRYDACRRDAMASCEKWRLKCWELEGKDVK